MLYKRPNRRSETSLVGQLVHIVFTVRYVEVVLSSTALGQVICIAKTRNRQIGDVVGSSPLAIYVY